MTKCVLNHSDMLAALTAVFISIFFCSCHFSNTDTINVTIVKDGKAFLLEGEEVDKWKLNSFLNKDYVHDGLYRDISLRFGAEDTTESLKVLYAAQERFEPERTFRVSFGNREIRFKRYLIDDPLIPLLNCYVVQMDKAGRLGKDVYYLNDLSLFRWHKWWEERHWVVYQTSGRPKPSKTECVVEKTTGDLGFMQSNNKTGPSILIIAERELLLSRMAEVVACYTEHYDCDIYLMCGDYEFNKWLAADFPEVMVGIK